ncbi:MAG: DUF3592 domain-containing protein [Myxococcota bacterium]
MASEFARPFLLDPVNEEYLAGKRPAPMVGGPGCAPVLTALFLVAGLVFGAVVGERWWEWFQLKAFAQSTQGVVTSRRTTLVTRGPGFYVSYRYDVAGKSHETSQPVPPALHDVIPEGTQVEVRYSTRDPAVAELARDARHGGVTLLIITLLFPIWLLLPSGLLVLFALQFRRRRALLRGQRITGEVVTCTGTPTGAELGVDVTYRFTTPEGETRTERAFLRRKDLTPQTLPAPGTPVVVLYAGRTNFLLL